ncbi:MAG: DUF4430 domain-containing protein [Solirubrobacterales bacterium]
MKLASAFVLIATCAALGAGCGSGSSGPATHVVVTRDFGAKVVATATEVDATSGLTAMRQLQSVHTATTSYGGRYVDSIEGLKEDGDSSWLYYVNGIESTNAASSERLKAGQTVQWDFHAWQTIRTGGAIVGAYPQPLKTGGVRLICAPERSQACRVTREGLVESGIAVNSKGSARVVVGTWSDIQGFDGVPDLTSDGETNGAFAQFSSSGGKLTPFSADGSEGRALKSKAGLLAPFAQDGKNVVWVVTGVDDAGVESAARLLDGGAEKLKNRFALLTSPSGSDPLPEGAGE